MLPKKLEARDLRKVYPGTVALDGVSLGLRAGEVHALVGRNGAGKSTLVKVLSGAVTPSGGELLLDGQPLRLRSCRDALAAGIATVYQELSLVPELSVAENIVFGRWPRRRWLGGWLIDWAAVYRQAEELTASLGVELDLRARVGGLGMARQQLVEIVKAMSYRPGVLLLDEPTSALAHHEVDRLLQLVRTLAASGVAVIYISHRLHELPQVADRVSVLRDGRLAGEAPIAEVSPRWLAERMFGEDIKAGQPSAVPPPGLPAFELVHFTRHGRFEDVSLGVRAGEVLGIAGMLGSGRTELLMSAFGAEPFDVGQVIVGGVTVARPTPARMKAAGVALAPEDRKRQALVLLRSIRENLCMAAGPRLGRFGFTSRARERPLVAAMRRRLAIHMSDAEEPVESLSGGNQQKVVLGNWLATRPRVILLDEPTRGIDVHAKQQAFELIRQLSVEGVATILVSSELEELLEVCHRILVMRGGRLVGELDAGTTDARGLLAAVVEENALQIEN